jgi:hypothetical protein
MNFACKQHFMYQGTKILEIRIAGEAVINLLLTERH